MIGAKLVPGEDDDLIKFFDEVPPGKKSQVIKAMLRSVVGNGVGAYLEPEPEKNPDAMQEIDQLRRELDQWIANDLPELVARMFEESATPTVDEDTVRRIVEEVVKQSPGSSNGAAKQAAVEESERTLSRKAQLQRMSKVKARQW